MHIDRLEIKGFGALKNRLVPLKKGLNILFGSNESGKSTLQWYIRGMLFGLKSGRQQFNGLTPPLKRFQPWTGSSFGGAMVYTLEDGSSFRVERNFENGTVQVYDRSYTNITPSFEIGKDKMPMLAERQIGMDEATFERTALIRQMDIRMDEEQSTSLAGKLTNVFSTGSEEISLDKAEKALRDAVRNNVGTARTRIQPLDKLEARLRELEKEHVRLKRQQESRSTSREELQAAKKLRIRLEAREQYLEHVGKLVETRRLLDDYLKKEIGLKNAFRQLRELEKDSCQTADPAEHMIGNRGDHIKVHHVSGGSVQKILTAISMTAAGVFASLLCYSFLAGAMKNSLNLNILYIAGLFTFATVGLLQLKSNGNKAGHLSTDKPAVLDKPLAAGIEQQVMEHSIISNAALVYGKHLSDASSVGLALRVVSEKLEELSNKLEKDIDAAMRYEYGADGFFCPEVLDMVVCDTEWNSLEAAWKNERDIVGKALLEAALKEKYYEGLLRNDIEKSDELQRVEEETVAVKEKITYLKYTGNALNLALEVLTEAGNEIRKTFAPGLNQKMSNIIAGLTGGRYTDLRGNDRLSLKVSHPESGDIRNVLLLSGAATDQMYLALRLAMTELLTAGGESMPLIMDEVFSQFDDNRTLLALKYLHNAYDKKQILIFTCKQREVELAREVYGDGMNLVEMEYEIPLQA